MCSHFFVMEWADILCCHATIDNCVWHEVSAQSCACCFAVVVLLVVVVVVLKNFLLLLRTVSMKISVLSQVILIINLKMSVTLTQGNFVTS